MTKDQVEFIRTLSVKLAMLLERPLLDNQAWLSSMNMTLRTLGEHAAAKPVPQPFGFAKGYIGNPWKVGDRVKLNGTCRPAYMIGKTGSVTKVNPTSVGILLDNGEGRFGGVKPIRCPLSLVEKE
jgi:hypothetical protein